MLFRISILLMLLTPNLLLADNISWPNLKKIGHVKNRVANMVDIKKGHAAFVLQDKINRRFTGKPIRILIPQYGYSTNLKTGKKIPVVLIQAEKAHGMKMAGIKYIGTNKLAVVPLKDLELLGNKKPD